MARDRTPTPAEEPTTPIAPVTPNVPLHWTSRYRQRISDTLGHDRAAIPLGLTAGLAAGTIATSQAPTWAAPYLPTITPETILTTGVAPGLLAYGASSLISKDKPYLRSFVGASAAGAGLILPSHVTVPAATAIVSMIAANKAVQWGGLNRSVYKSMEGPGYWNFTKRHITSTPGKLAMGFFYSGWNPALHDDLRWQERIGAVVPQLARGLVRPFYTPWEKLQGFEAVPGALIRPVVSAVSTVWNAIPGSGMFKSPDKFGEGVGNIALAPFRAPGYVWGKMKDFWKWGTSEPSVAKK